MSIVTGNSILVTGGTGSFGHAFVKHLLAMPAGPKRVCIFSRDEYKQGVMRAELNDDHRLRWFLGDVRDLERLKTALHGVNLVIHAAAMKQVPACEDNPFECFETNYSGSVNVIRAAIACHVPRVIGLSTDKAVQPCTTYGASKLAMERAFVNGNAVSVGVSKLSCTRYGNVQDSRLSVLPVWRALIARGEPVTITDPEATRFHMEQREAVDLVLLAASWMQGGEIFVPKLPAYRLGDLVNSVAGPDYPRTMVGLRVTEKKHETLISPDEVRLTRDFGDHYRVLPARHTWRDNGTAQNGAALPPGFVYRSDTVRLIGDALKELAEERCL